MTVPNLLDLPTTAFGLLPEVDRRAQKPRPGRFRSRAGVQDQLQPVLNFRQADGYAVVGGTWAAGVTSGSATFEGWIRTSITVEQTIFLGPNSPGAGPRISVGGNQLRVYWNAAGDAPGWVSADTTPVADGQWHHLAVVFNAGTVQFFKDGVALDSMAVDDSQLGTGALQLGAGFGSAVGFVGQMWNLRVWSVPVASVDIDNNRWASLTTGNGLTASVGFDVQNNTTVNTVDGSWGGLFNSTNLLDLAIPSPTCALSLPGKAEAFVSIFGVAPSFDSSTGLAFESWVNIDPSRAAVKQSISTIELSGQPPSGLTFFYAGADAVGFSWSGTTFTSADTRPVADGTWHHLALVFDSNYATLYKDGVACADVYQLAATQTIESGTFVFGVGPTTGINGQDPFGGLLYDLRVWTGPRSAAQISGYRWATMTGQEPGLDVLFNLTGCDPAVPDGMRLYNQVDAKAAIVLGEAAVVVAALPGQLLPTGVWVYPTPGVSPIGPSTSPQGVLCTANGSDSTPGAFLQSVDVQTGQVGWSYDARAESSWADAVVASAVAAVGTTAYVGVTSGTVLDNTFLELHVVDTTSGTLVGDKPVQFPAQQFLTRPVPMPGGACVGVAIDNLSCGLAWYMPQDGYAIRTSIIGVAQIDKMSDPLIAGGIAYTAVGQGGQTTVAAYQMADADTSAEHQPLAPNWSVTLPAELTGNLAINPAGLFAPTGGTMVALDLATGEQLWSRTLSNAPVNTTPALVGTTVCIGSSDGTVYALDAGTGQELWVTPTGSTITTDLLNLDGVLYFANQGDGADTPPQFVAVDAVSLGNDVLTYEVPDADTLLFVTAGASNGVVYFYSLSNTYAVNMSNVIREFAVDSQLIVEDFTYPDVGGAQGNNTSYRVTLTLRDQDGTARVNEAVKVWADGTLTIVNQGQTPLVIGPDNPIWLLSDQDGALTLAINAWDTTNPDGNTTLSCPALNAWANFLPAQEFMVIYPDHEQLVSLSTLKGTPNDDDPGAATGPAVLYLDAATGYDGQPLISSDYNNDTSLPDIAATVRNTIGNVNAATANAALLAGSRRNQYLRRRPVAPNALYSIGDEPTTRAWMPGAEPTFTMVVLNGTTSYSTTYDPSPPPTAAAAVGSIFTDIKDFSDHVIKSTEQVVKMAWTLVNDVVATVIHTVDTVEKDVANEYQLAIRTLEDAVTAVTGFFTSVVDDVKRAVEWLSALFDWGNILANHKVIRAQITNLIAPGNPDPAVSDSITQRLGEWLNGSAPSDIASTLANLVSQGGQQQLSTTGTGMAGQTVGQQSAGNNDPSTAYNTGGQNNATQCSFLHQKLKENTGVTTGPALNATPTAANGDVFDSSIITAAWDAFLQSGQQALSGFSDLPSRLKTQLSATSDQFKDPKSIVSTGFADFLAIFEDLADDMVKFIEVIGPAVLTLLQQTMDQLLNYLLQPIDIPFISDLWKAITGGDSLTVVDLMCLLAAVPATILLGVITGSPVLPPGNAQVPTQILLGAATFTMAAVAASFDAVSLFFTTSTTADQVAGATVGKVDLGCDFLSWALGMVASDGWSTFDAKDWVFWSVQSVPIIGNFVTLFYTPSVFSKVGGLYQIGRDVIWGVSYLVLASVYAGIWPSQYRDAHKAPGLVITGNVLAAMGNLIEFLLTVFDADTPEGGVVFLGKVLFADVSAALGFTSNVLSAE